MENKLQVIEKKEIFFDHPVKVKRSDTGLVLAAQVPVALDANKGDLVFIPEAKKWTISVQGYDKLNKVAGIHLWAPPSIMFDGLERNNPHIDYMDDHNIRTVLVKYYGFGRNMLGNHVNIAMTVAYSPGSYFRVDLIKLAREKKGIATLVNTKAPDFQQKVDYWYLPVEDGLALECDLNNAEFLKKFNTYQQNRNFAVRKATSICIRNIFKKHPAIGMYVVSPPNESGVVMIPIISWREKELSHVDAMEMLRQISIENQSDLIQYEEHTIGAEEIDAEDMADDSEMVDQAEATKITVQEVQAEEQAKAESQQPDPPASGQQPAGILNDLLQYRDAIGEDCFNALISRVGQGKPLDQLTEQEVRQAMSECIKMI